MNHKMELDEKALADWQRDNWYLYSSQMYDGKLLRLWINGIGDFKVVHGGETLYRGSQRTHAVAAWKAA